MVSAPFRQANHNITLYHTTYISGNYLHQGDFFPFSHTSPTCVPLRLLQLHCLTRRPAASFTLQANPHQSIRCGHFAVCGLCSDRKTIQSPIRRPICNETSLCQLFFCRCHARRPPPLPPPTTTHPRTTSGSVPPNNIAGTETRPPAVEFSPPRRFSLSGNHSLSRWFHCETCSSRLRMGRRLPSIVRSVPWLTVCGHERQG